MILILASKYDLSCDYIVAKLRDLNHSYIRINSEDLPSFKFTLDPVSRKLQIKGLGSTEEYTSVTIKSIYYRRPVFLREYGYTQDYSLNKFQQLHWAVLIRNLMVYDECFWMNHPQSTYLAEHKGIQLFYAAKVGFDVPKTLFTNSLSSLSSDMIADNNIVVKGIDTVLYKEEEFETFGFTHFVDVRELTEHNLKLVPATLQQPIKNKIDIRVTVIGDTVLAASIKSKEGNGVPKDWREHKENIEYHKYELPYVVKSKCVDLARQFNLVFGSIDLLFSEGKYYFLEINPTGEWAWLVDSAKLPIDTAIAKCLVMGSAE